MLRPHHRKARPTIPILLLLATACGTPKNSLGSRGADDTGGGDDESSTSGGNVPIPPGVLESGSDDEPVPGPPTSFVDNPDGGGISFECDLFAQDCPLQEKCMPWANDGGGAWNATRCSPIAKNADEVGEPCTVEGSGVSGIDSCVLGAMCWNVDSETNEGECVALCIGDEANPICENPNQFCTGRFLMLCLDSCCPLEQQCPEYQACYPIGQSFGCAPNVSGDMGGFGDPCEFINVCDSGLACINPDAVPDCPSTGCCSPYCHVGSTECEAFDPQLECVPWYLEGEAPPGLDHVGICALPE